MYIVEHSDNVNAGLLHIARFDSVYDFAVEADRTKDSPLANADEFGGVSGRISLCPNNKLYRMTGNNTFTGGMEFDGAVRAAKEGYEYGREKIAEMIARIQTPASMGARTIQAKPLYGLCGGQVDVGRFLGGDPNCFRVWKRQITPNAGRVLSVVLSGGMSCEVTAQPVLIRGAAVCAFVDIAEKSGYRCELWSNLVTTTGPHRIEYQVKVKRDSDPLDIDAISFALCHVAFSRRLGFAHKESTPAAFRNAIGITEHQSYGYPGQTIMQGNVNIPALNSGNFMGEDGAVTWIEGELQKIGVLEGTPQE